MAMIFVPGINFESWFIDKPAVERLIGRPLSGDKIERHMHTAPFMNTFKIKDGAGEVSFKVSNTLFSRNVSKEPLFKSAWQNLGEWARHDSKGNHFSSSYIGEATRTTDGKKFPLITIEREDGSLGVLLVDDVSRPANVFHVEIQTQFLYR